MRLMGETDVALSCSVHCVVVVVVVVVVVCCITLIGNRVLRHSPRKVKVYAV